MTILEEREPFSRSMIWKLQRDYFSEAGIDAWRSGEVPHYITSNPVVGKTYAELVLAILRDLAFQGKTREIVYLVELGAGHGRLCYHFLKHFERFYRSGALPLPPFRYILSDFADATIDFWREHPRFRPYIDKGMLDFALFDAEHSEHLALKHTGVVLGPGSSDQPLIVMANYFFDTIPQDLFRIRDGTIEGCLVSLSTGADPSKASVAELIDMLEIGYEYEKLARSPYADYPVADKILREYGSGLRHTHLLFPKTGIDCLERLSALSRRGLVLLSSDKGEHHISNLDGYPPPALSKHGSFSLSVNYHALRQYCVHRGGMPLFPRQLHKHLDHVCFFFLSDARLFTETVDAYERYVGDFGPDDYFSLKKLIEKHLDELTYNDIMGAIRLSGYDARLFLQMFPRLIDILPSISENERWNVLLIVPRIWDTYYPLGEGEDLAFALGYLLECLSFYKEAFAYYRLSLTIYGKTAGSLFRIAHCYCDTGDRESARSVIDELKAYDDGSDAFTEAMKELENALQAEVEKETD